MLTITAIPCLKDNYIWCIQNNDCCILIDPGEASPAIHHIEQHQLKLLAILITHHHWDHSNGLGELAQRYSCQIIASEVSPLENITKKVKDGEMIHFKKMDFSITALAIPGHTLDHTAYYYPNHLFTGDTLFTAGCGRVFEGSLEQMYHSLQKLNTYPENTLIYCGHEYTEKNLQFAATIERDNLAIQQRLTKTIEKRKQSLATVPATLAEERATNPFLRSDEATLAKVISNLESNPIKPGLELFKTLRQLKDHF